MTHQTPGRRAHIAVATAATTVLASASVALASIGVGVGASPVTLNGVAKRGHHYNLTDLYVVNTGTQTATYGFRVGRIPPRRPGRDVPVHWIRFSYKTITLRAKQGVYVKVRLRVPRKAKLGPYSSDISAYLVQSNRAGTNAGVAAATLLLFRVGH